MDEVRAHTTKMVEDAGGKISFWVRENPELIGGIQLRIGDTIYDVEGAAAFGIPTVGVRWGYGDPEEMLRAGATAVLDTPEDLLDYLTGPDGSGAE